MSNKFLFPLLVFMVCQGCAQLASPAGGPRDEDPPVVLESDPPNYSIRFEAKRIEIKFDEYIVLDNVNQELIVSPPMEEKPEVKLRKKTMIIEFEEDLKPYTTYTFNFGSSIKDLHEGNKLLNFEYVFSTGDVLDSLSVRGTLKYAKDLTVPDEPVSIMLYNDLRDSVPLTEIPLYVGKSDDSGVFSVNNLRADVYKVFALKDGNNNFLFDLPTEEIAFLDTSLIVRAEFARFLLLASGAIDSIPEKGASPVTDSLSPVDTLQTDTIGMPADSVMELGPDLNSIYIDLQLFSEESEIQYLTENKREDRRRIDLVFALPLTDSFNYKTLPVNAPGKIEYLEHYSRERDSLTLWIKDSLYYMLDTLQLQVNYTVKDTANQYVVLTDTLRFIYREKRTNTRRQETTQQQPKKLQLTTIKNRGKQELHRDLPVTLDLPLHSVTDSLIKLYHIPDSVEMEVPFNIQADTTLLNRAWISASWESAAKYRLIILPGAFTSIYPLKHDSIDVSFTSRDIEHYGQILLSLKNVTGHTVIQLISREKVLQERSVAEDGTYTFSYLIPQDYHIKFIHDRNGNGKWDTGKYMKKLQPENVELLPVTVTVRSNWDHDVSMTLEN